MEAVGIALACVATIAIAVLVYAQSRSVRASAAGAFLTARRGRISEAILQPSIVWDPREEILRGARAPRLYCMTADQDAEAHHEISLVHPRTGEISLKVHACSPRPFSVRTADNRQLRVRARAAFRLDPDRLDTAAQIEAFGSLMSARIRNLFENEIGAHENEQVRARQTDIEATVLSRLQEIEAPGDPVRPRGMPLGVIFLETAFSFDPVAGETLGVGNAIARGPMSYSAEEIDELADTIEKTDPRAMETITRMIELQTRQNIVEMLCRTGGLVAFTAPELGLTDAQADKGRRGVNRFNGQAAAPEPAAAEPPAPAPAPSYYDLPPPKHAG